MASVEPTTTTKVACYLEYAHRPHRQRCEFHSPTKNQLELPAFIRETHSKGEALPFKPAFGARVFKGSMPAYTIIALILV
jgi:hypothetical protein